MKTRMYDVTNQRFGRLVALKYKDGKWRCKCDCGKFKWVGVTFLRIGNTRSCGCLARETLAANSAACRLHGMCATSEYSSWEHAKARCFKPKQRGYHNYGGRGITMCKEWQDDFRVFIKHMGPKPTPKHELERINNNGNYEPGNCRWATRKEQMCNTRRNVNVTWRGETKTIQEWAKQLGWSWHCMYNRIIRRQWPMERAMMPKQSIKHLG